MAQKSDLKKQKKNTVNIKKGDTVKVIAGQDKGAEGKVIAVLREEQRVIVEGVNRVKRHTKVVQSGGRAGTTGGIITTEAPIHVSNVMLVEGDGGRGGLPPRRGPSAATTARRTPRAAASASPARPARKSDDRHRQPRATRPRPRRGHRGTAPAEKVTPRLKTRYREEILLALKSEFDIPNVMQVPGLTKIVVNMGVGEAARDSKLIEGAVKDLTAITGQKPTVTRPASPSPSSSCARACRSAPT